MNHYSDSSINQAVSEYRDKVGMIADELALLAAMAHVPTTLELADLFRAEESAK